MTDMTDMSEPFDASGLERALERVVVVGRRIEFHRVIESTNDRARELAAAGEPEGTAVIAGEQTRGRGRSDRAWHSAGGLGLYLSVILRPSTPPASAPLLGLMAAVAAANALGSMAPGRIRIQWPNDLVATQGDPAPGSRWLKLAGVLAEARTGPDRIRDLVIGVGVNVDHRPEEFPKPIAGRAVSLRMLTGVSIGLHDVAARILTSMDGWYNLWRLEGPAPVLAGFRSLALDLEGRHVQVRGGGEPWRGTTAGLSDDGALRVLPIGAQHPIDVRYGDLLRVEEDDEGEG